MPSIFLGASTPSCPDAAAGVDPDQEFFRRSKRLQGLEGMFIHQVSEINSYPVTVNQTGAQQGYAHRPPHSFLLKVSFHSRS